MYAGKKIKSLRQSRNLSQEDFASALNISQPYYSAIESGKKQVSKKLLVTIKHLYGVNLDTYDAENSAKNEIKEGVFVGGIYGDKPVELRQGLTKEDLNVFFEALIASQYKGEGKVDYYYKHSTHKIDIILSNLKKELETVYNDNVKLITVSEKFGAPPFMHAEKFPQPDDFKDYIKKQNADFKEDNEDISDPKLLKCIKIVAYEEDIEHWRRLLSYLIDYMHQYYDLYDTLFEKHHNSPHGHNKD